MDKNPTWGTSFHFFGQEPTLPPSPTPQPCLLLLDDFDSFCLKPSYSLFLLILFAFVDAAAENSINVFSRLTREFDVRSQGWLMLHQKHEVGVKHEIPLLPTTWLTLDDSKKIRAIRFLCCRRQQRNYWSLWYASISLGRQSTSRLVDWS